MRHTARTISPLLISDGILHRLLAQGFAPTLNYFCSIAAFSFLSA
ncbi:MAG: hypothetical protein ACXW1C_05250 [Gallionella sp.]